MKRRAASSGFCRGHRIVGHAIGHTVAALPLGLRAYASSGLREGPPTYTPDRNPHRSIFLGQLSCFRSRLKRVFGPYPSSAD